MSRLPPKKWGQMFHWCILQYVFLVLFSLLVCFWHWMVRILALVFFLGGGLLERLIGRKGVKSYGALPNVIALGESIKIEHSARQRKWQLDVFPLGLWTTDWFIHGHQLLANSVLACGMLVTLELNVLNWLGWKALCLLWHSKIRKVCMWSYICDGLFT